MRSPGLLVSRAETDIGDRYAFSACLDRHAARRAAPDRDTLYWPAGPAHLPESARGRTYPGRENDTGDNDIDRNGGQGKDAGGHTNASACVPRTGNGCGDCASASPTASTCAAPARRASCAVGVDLPLDAGACGRMVHAESQRCIHCTKRRWWLIKHALNGAEVAVTAILENDTLQRASEDDPLDNLPAVVPTLDDLSDPCLRW